MDSDDDQCDLETLEALLDDEDDNEENSGTGQPVDRKAEAEPSVETVADFLNAASDSDDEYDKFNTDKSTEKAKSGCDELDALADLMEKDSDFEDETRTNDSISQQNVPGSHTDDSPSTCTLKKSEISQEERSPKNISDRKQANFRQDQKCSRSTNKKSTPGLSAVRKDQLPLNSTSASQPSNLSDTQALVEEMAKMRQKMLEMEKLLQQQQKTQTVNDTEQLVNNHVPSEKRHDQKNRQQQKVTPRIGSVSSKVWQSSSQDVKQQSSKLNKVKESPQVKKASGILKLLPDNDDNDLFSSQKISSKTPAKSSPQTTKIKTSASSNKKSPRGKMEKDLFGDSDSDWEDMDTGEKKILSEAGKDIQRLIHSGKVSREAHQAKYSMSDTRHGVSHTWARHSHQIDEEKERQREAQKNEKIDKNALQCKASSSDQAKPASSTTDSDKVVTEDFSKIKILNPLISSTLMKMRMEGRKMISVSRIHMKLKTTDLQGDWVTIAVVVGKSDSKSSKTGKPFCIWKLNDLEDLDNSVSFFLFGEVHKTLWKTDVGTVVGVLNPSIMESMEKSNSEPAFTIKNPSQLMIVGRSKDLGWCIARTKAGNKCNKFINKKYGEYCAYHVQAEYRKTSAKRLELHGSIAGIRPKSFEKKIFSKDCAYMYGGHTFVPNSSSSKDKSKKSVSLSKLQQSITSGRHQKVNTLSIHNVKPEPTDKKKPGKIEEDADSTFVDMISVPSPGSMNLVAFLKKKEETRNISKSPQTSKQPGITSITPRDLIKQHQQVLRQKQANKVKASDRLLATPTSNQRMTSGAAAVKTEADPLKQTPMLGKGFYRGQDISLDVSNRSISLADRTKLKAVAAIKDKGGLQKEDPNAVKKVEGKDLNKINKRVKEDCDKSSSEEQTTSPRQSTSAKEPPKKKSKLLGNVDLNSDEVKSILKARSKHKGALAEAEAEREEKFFNELEKKEMLEEKMKSVMSIEITVITCKQCLYTAQSAKDSCKQEGHTLTRSKTKKRFFMCKKCKHRTYVIGGKFPTEPCRKCGAQTYEKTSMYKERSGPKLESEVLNIRGDEIKYLNSMDQKVFLNTVIDD